MNVIIFDFEVFKEDVLLGAYKLVPGKEKEKFAIWSKKEIVEFYQSNLDAVWIGHNNSHYDNYILQAIVLGQDPYKTSVSIIEKNERIKLVIPLAYYDLMSNHFASLKALEAFDGKDISESQVDFRIQRFLTANEKAETETYNENDLSQTYDDLIRLKDEFQLRLDIMKEFGMSRQILHMTEAQIAAAILGAKQIKGIAERPAEPIMYDNLRVTNEKAIAYYKDKSWAWNNESGKSSIELVLCGTPHTVAAGGIHAGKIRHEKEAYYIDVSGYYNLIMINYDLLPRSIPEEGKRLYEYMYHEQLKLKKTNPVKRKVYKTILLAVFGAMNNEHCDFYDPNQGDLVRLTGEMFLIDLLEKLEGKFDVIQSNTDGIMLKPLPGVDGESLMPIIDEWQRRTKFVLKVERIYDIVQRDVNNYMYHDDQGRIHTKGEAVKHCFGDASPFDTDAHSSKDPLIIAKCIVEYYMNGKKPEDVIKACSSNLRLFQCICKKGIYDWLEIDYGAGKTERLQNVNRIFVGKEYGALFKVKNGRRTKYASLPFNAFVHNGEVLSSSAVESITKKLDYDYYVSKAYKRIKEFELPVVLV